MPLMDRRNPNAIEILIRSGDHRHYTWKKKKKEICIELAVAEDDSVN